MDANSRLKRFKKIYPVYAGFSADLLFWIAIDTLFLVEVKKFSSAQIVSLTTVSLVSCLILQIPLLALMRKIGNVRSVRLGTFVMLCSSLLLTFGVNYYFVAAGKVCREIGLTLRNMIGVTLKNNLDSCGESENYIRYRTKGMSVYSVLTMIISFIASFMFNLDKYLPMYACIACCLFSFVMSLFITEEKSAPNTAIAAAEEETVETDKTVAKKSALFVVLLFVTYALGYTVVSSGQSESKLFIQEYLYGFYDAEKVVLLIGVMVAISRVIRVLSNLFFNRIYLKLRKNIVFYLMLMLCFSMALLVFAYFVPISVTAKYVLMLLAYIIILFMRDPFNSCIQELALNSCKNKKQQINRLSMLEFYYKLFYAVMSFAFSMLLLKYPMILIIAICAAVAAIGSVTAFAICRLNAAFTKSKRGETR